MLPFLAIILWMIITDPKLWGEG